jgi:hypothetical protein
MSVTSKFIKNEKFLNGEEAVLIENNSGDIIFGSVDICTSRFDGIVIASKHSKNVGKYRSWVVDSNDRYDLTKCTKRIYGEFTIKVE